MPAHQGQVSGDRVTSHQPFQSVLRDLHLNQSKNLADRAHAVRQPAVGGEDQRRGGRACLRGVHELFDDPQVNYIAANDDAPRIMGSPVAFASEAPSFQGTQAIGQGHAISNASTTPAAGETISIAGALRYRVGSSPLGGALRTAARFPPSTRRPSSTRTRTASGAAAQNSRPSPGRCVYTEAATARSRVLRPE